MDAVAAAFIGSSVLGAGKPNAFGTFSGAVLIGILQNGLIMDVRSVLCDGYRQRNSSCPCARGNLLQAKTLK